MTPRRPDRGVPGERARAALAAIWQRYDQQVADLNTVAGLADEIAEREEKLGVVVARLHGGGMSVSELATCAGIHPNRLRRLMERHHTAAGE